MTDCEEGVPAHILTNANEEARRIMYNPYPGLLLRVTTEE